MVDTVCDLEILYGTIVSGRNAAAFVWRDTKFFSSRRDLAVRAKLSKTEGSENGYETHGQ